MGGVEEREGGGGIDDHFPSSSLLCYADVVVSLFSITTVFKTLTGRLYGLLSLEATLSSGLQLIIQTWLRFSFVAEALPRIHGSGELSCALRRIWLVVAHKCREGDQSGVLDHRKRCGTLLVRAKKRWNVQ